MNTFEAGNTGMAISADDGVNTIQFDRLDKKNAITKKMYAQMASALESGDASASIRAHIFLGQPGVFTAGNDLSDFLGAEAGEVGLGEDVLRFLRALITVKKPILAAVDGAAIGIGTTLLMHCDLVYATPRSYFQTPFVDLGLVPEAASSYLAPRLFGPQRAFALLALGKRWTADEALAGGLVNALIEEQNIHTDARSIALELARKPQHALATTRQLLRGDTERLLSRIELEAEHFARHLASEEAQAAFSSFFKRR